MKQWQGWPIKELRLAKKGLPRKVYLRGDPDDQIFKRCLAVVGARNITGYGEAVVEKLIPGLVNAGLTIVSGFMYGVDTKAHRVCLESGGRTIAVLGCGLNVLFPPENGKLYSQILAKGGLVLSEYEPKEKPARWMFPQRNRIVAGLSQGILVVEAGEKSGSLITARIGFQQKKKVMAVPGPINSSLSVGTNWLIRNGAVAVTRVEEILEELPHFRKVGKGKTSKQRVLSDLAPKEKRIIKELEKEALEVDDLARKLRFNVVELGSLLSLMSLKGLVKERVGKYSLS